MKTGVAATRFLVGCGPPSSLELYISDWTSPRSANSTLHQCIVASASPSLAQASTAALAITDEASPFALRSTRINLRTAVRRGAARPQRSDQAAAGETLSRAGRRPHRRACMGCRAPQAPVHKNTVGRPSARSLGVVAREVRMPAAPSSPVRVLGQRPVSGVRCPVSGVRCERPVSTLACPWDRCPVSGAGV